MSRYPLYCLILLSSVAFFVSDITGQTTPRPRNVTTPAFKRPSWDSYINITDFNGRLFQNKYPDVEGSPYFIDSFRFANITTNKGSVYENVKTRIDLHSNEIQLVVKEGKEIIAEDGLIKNILLVDSSEAEPVHFFFRSGYPAIDKNTDNTFYEVLSDGNIQLLRHITKEIQETKNEMSGEISKQFIKREEYYIFLNGQIRKIKRDKDFIFEIMSDKKDKIEEYLKGKKLNFKNTEMLTRLFEYYNSLKKPF